MGENLFRLLEEVDNVLDECDSLSGRLEAYWRVLVRKGLRIAMSQGLDTIITSSPVHLAADVVIKEDDDYVDACQVIELARSSYPGIFTKYQEGLKRLKELKVELTQAEEYMRANYPVSD